MDKDSGNMICNIEKSVILWKPGWNYSSAAMDYKMSLENSI